MSWVVGIGYNEGVADPVGSNTKKDIEDLRIGKVRDVKALQTFFLDGDVTREDVERVCKDLFVDNVVQFYNFGEMKGDGSHVENLVKDRGVWVVEIMPKPGVMDPVGLSSERAISVMGVPGVKSVGTGTTFVIDGDFSEQEIESVCRKSLANGLVQNFRFRRLE
ncbi:MAG: phosphoribosylformylglycinamidine synthase subunit PurS [Candidatus Aenigmarchaeota archaeon]|nr:phosphoribosylformylglycinamidine synthase subunit PurS [Candidatus Aenigmarchaeota archaeon]